MTAAASSLALGSSSCAGGASTVICKPPLKSGAVLLGTKPSTMEPAASVSTTIATAMFVIAIAATALSLRAR